jgi:hypothetical protein
MRGWHINVWLGTRISSTSGLGLVLCWFVHHIVPLLRVGRHLETGLVRELSTMSHIVPLCSCSSSRNSSSNNNNNNNKIIHRLETKIGIICEVLVFMIGNLYMNLGGHVRLCF